ncbi:hypothetical protein [Jatrophihabitans sp.]|uniref:hypothetical protein n=1 Tax=Jatrophihabitans sp. TaxID=1932789 RepID=UPI0030C6EAE6
MPRVERLPRKIAGRSGRRPDGRQGEVRLPAALAVLVAIGLYAALPNSLLLGPRYVIPTIEVLLLIPLIAINPTRLTRETRWSRIVSLGLAYLIIVANLVALGMLLHALTSSHVTQGRQLLLAALQVWITDIIAFGLVYWELDRGGAVARTSRARAQLQRADFRFTQDEDDDTVNEVAAGSSAVSDWVPTFVDYLYVSITNSTAFSPTDTMPLSHRAKLLMSVEAIAALVTSLLVIARAVSILH